MSSIPRLHNKSGLEELTLLTYDDRRLRELDNILATALQHGSTADGLLPSKCRFTRAADGRLSQHGKKPCYAYQLVALRRFTRDKLKRVTASKLGKDFTISHLCGSLLCCNAEHLFLETKRTNDERTHCHFVLSNISKQRGFDRLRKFVDRNKYQYCQHVPRCGLPPAEGETESQEVQLLLSQESPK